jgi:hypothetical protein
VTIPPIARHARRAFRWAASTVEVAGWHSALLVPKNSG